MDKRPKTLKLKVKIFGTKDSYGKCGVWPFLIPEKHPLSLSGCCLLHDADYEYNIDWTKYVQVVHSNMRLENCWKEFIKQYEDEYQETLLCQIHKLMKLVYAWGRMRFYTYKFGLWKPAGEKECDIIP